MMVKEVSIIGLGLIGTSLARGVKKCGFASRVIGLDMNADHSRMALDAGYIDEVVDMERACKASIVVVAAPVDVSGEIVREALDKSGEDTIVIDVCSTKKNIVDMVSSHPSHSRFVPTHPMAGTENSGPMASLDDLFYGHTVIVLPYPDADVEKVKVIETMYETLGAEIVQMTPAAHDESVAYVSHISHISSYALALTVLNKERSQENIMHLAGGGFASTARLAKSSPDMWVPIFTENREAIIDVLDEYIENVILFKHAIKSANADVVRTLISQANRVRGVLEEKEKKSKNKR